MEDPKPVQLSKSILEMKFMKKTKEKVLKEIDDAEGKAMYSGEITDEMRKTGNIIFKETSMTICKDFIDGRLSFHGMNKDIEKLMKNDYSKQLDEFERKKEKDITDEDMAKGYSTVVDTIGKKFNKKKNKNKFMKPSNDV